jgi:broad specificity phosphatase PhoE
MPSLLWATRDRGWPSNPYCSLTDDGLEQARRLAIRLTTYDLSGFAGLTSPYRRATQTAEVIAAFTKLAFTADEGGRGWGPPSMIKCRH